MKIEIDETTGKVSFSINELLAQLDDDAKIEIAKEFAWDSVMYDELKKNILHGYAAESYNGDVRKMRIAFLTEEGADERVRDMVEGLLRELKDAKAQMDEWQNTYFRIYHDWHEIQLAGCEPYKSFPVDSPRWRPGPPVTQEEIDEVINKSVA